MIKTSADYPILIIEDSDDDFEATERALKRDGALINPIYRCDSGEDALDFLLQQGPYSDPLTAPRPSIILMDLNMPGLDGREVLARIKSDERLLDIPVVVLTTSNDSFDIKACYQAGANSYVAKPVEMDEFILAIKRLKEYWFGISILPKGKTDGR
ncbi:response regulator [Cohaesibacter celericrescens]|uniref:Two-component system response regulator n=1 Tax=Cohaesibacter celericrescens TaxID=2067669 RepID=A0A2N5XX17_9HYPH|nr:response regulator [Cohaesibacter celericrescens]PLW79042.1 two-component system response regulator [Cohaesibacter celericrescens]